MSLLMVSGPAKPVTFADIGGGGGLTPDFTAASVARDDVEDMLDLITAAGAGKIGLIPAGTANWTSAIIWEAPANTTIIGAGSLSTTGGGDTTVIVDNIASGSCVLKIVTSATGTFRLAGLTIQGGTGGIKDNAMLIVSGLSKQLRLDHLTINPRTYTTEINISLLYLSGWMYGVVDHAIFQLRNQGNGIKFFHGEWNSDALGGGDESWAAATEFGSEKFLFVEDSQFNGLIGALSANDCGQGGRFVWRHNTMQAGLQNHATGSSNRSRGGRAFEIYENTYTSIAGLSEAAFTMMYVTTGTGVMWSNTVPNPSDFKHALVFRSNRRSNVTYTQTATPNGWGYCGPQRASGTVNVAANGVDVTKASGDNFSTSWPADSMIYIAGTSYIIASVGSTTALTLQGAGTGGALTGQTYAVGTNWDGNTDVYGYPALDQVGRGDGDLITGGDFPGPTPAWPNQALEPIYIWDMPFTEFPSSGGSYFSTTATETLENRDYYPPASGIQTNATTPFNGTVGTGWGTLANRPTTCTVGVGYWATDERKLYRCTTTNNWTLYYTPYQYPHPLNT